jgi:hypothetical protein
LGDKPQFFRKFSTRPEKPERLRRVDKRHGNNGHDEEDQGHGNQEFNKGET